MSKKKLSGILSLLFSVLTVGAQTPLDWHLLSPAKDKVYGAGILEACRQLESSAPKRKVVVALIDVGFDLQHEALSDKWWSNKKEIAGNGKDDDKNGYEDDIHGWNFLASVDGKLIENTSDEAFRQFLKLKDRFDELHAKQRNRKETEEYVGYFGLAQSSPLVNAYIGSSLSFNIGRSAEEINRLLLEKCPDREPGLEDLQALRPIVQQSGDTILQMAFYTYNMIWSIGRKNKKWEDIYRDRYKNSEIERQKYERALAALVDERSLSGDDLNNLSAKHYGNHEFLSVTADEGTAAAGVIAARGGMMKGIRGIADQVELMAIRAQPSVGDAYDKDVALAIRYAVAQGADIIQLGLGKYVLDNRKWIDEAIAYAEKRNVLIVHAAGDDFRHTDATPYFPIKQGDMRKREFGNIITVGASDETGTPYVKSNYGAGSVDVFAPGVNIYTTVRGDNYKRLTGTKMAASVVTGLAAVLKSYYPSLKASRIKEALVRTARQKPSDSVTFPHDPTNIAGVPTGGYERLCLSGGIVDAVAAVEWVREMYKGK